MKLVSIFFLIILIFPITYFLLHILSLYDSKGSLKVFGVDNDLIFALAKPYIFWLVIYSTALAASVYLNIKRKYTTNVIFLSVMILIYMFLPYFLRHL